MMRVTLDVKLSLLSHQTSSEGPRDRKLHRSVSKREIPKRDWKHSKTWKLVRQ